MPRWSGPARRVIRQAAAAVAAVTVLLGVTAAPASAHVRLVSAEPADGSTISTAVEAIEFTFDDRIRERFTTLVVTGPQGRSYLRGAPTVDRHRLRVPVYPTGSGAYRVAWRVVGSDGHPVQGEFRFQVALASGQEPAVTPPAARPDAPAGRSGAPWALVVGGVLVAVAAAVALTSRSWVLRRAPGRLSR